MYKRQEESYGYLSGGYVRDKDAVDASMLICEMAMDYRAKGKTLVDAMQDLYQKHGYYVNGLCNFAFEGEDGMKKMSGIMDSLRSNAPAEIAGYPVVGWSDYQESCLLYTSASSLLLQLGRQKYRCFWPCCVKLFC